MGWSWPGFLVPFPWALYRKMWSVAAAFAVLPIVVSLVSATGSVGAYGAFGLSAKVLYVWHACRKIEKIRAKSGSEAELLAKVDRAGGVSKAGAIFGGIVMACAFLLAVLAVVVAEQQRAH